MIPPSPIQGQRSASMDLSNMYAGDSFLRLALLSASFCQGMHHNLVFALLEPLSKEFDDYNTKRLLGMSFLVSNAICNPLWGYICDRHGQRLGILTGLALSFIGSVLVATAPTLWLCGLGRMMAGLSANVTLNRTYIGRVTNFSNQAKAFGLMTGIFGLAMTITPLIVLFPTKEVFPERSPAFATGAAGALIAGATFVVTYLKLPYLPAAAPAQSQDVESVVDQDAVTPKISIYMIAQYRLQIFAALSYGTVLLLLQSPDHTIIPPLIETSSASYLWSTQGAARTLSTIFLFPLVCAQIGVVNVNIMAVAMGFITIPSVYLATMIPWASGRKAAEIVAFVLRGTSVSLGITASAVLMNNATPAGIRTRTVGISQSFASMLNASAVHMLTELELKGISMGFDFLPFLILLIVCIASLIFVALLPQSLNRPHEERNK